MPVPLLMPPKNHLPVSIRDINKPGGGGAIYLSEIAAAHPGGYKIDLGTVELTTLPSLGMVRFKTSDFKPIARLNADHHLYHRPCRCTVE
ncbi:tripartite tricarboxylate transporter substrate-binding protein [Escherichia coli]|nr:tripartite tricarboxylate transporter substrate-binding protein [Escherichia coli]